MRNNVLLPDVTGKFYTGFLLTEEITDAHSEWLTARRAKV